MLAINFQGYKGHKFYSSQEERDMVNRAPEMTPEKIYYTLKKADTFDIGLNDVTAGIVKDTTHLANGFVSTAMISNKFLAESQRREKKLARKNPAGSFIPFWQIYARADNEEFIKKIDAYAKDVQQDWRDIKMHFQKPVISNAHEVLESIDYVEEEAVKSYGSGEKSIRTAMDTLRQGITDQASSITKEYIKPIDEKMLNLGVRETYADSIVAKQESRQMGKLVRNSIMTVVHMATGGLSFIVEGLTENIFENFGEKVFDVMEDFDVFNMVPKDATDHRSLTDFLADTAPDLTKTNQLSDFLNSREIFSGDKTREVFGSFIEPNGQSHLSRLKDNINWNAVQHNVGKNAVFTTITTFADTLDHTVRNGGKLNLKDAGKLFARNVLMMPALTMIDTSFDFIEHNTQIRGEELDESIENSIRKIKEKPGLVELLKNKDPRKVTDLIPGQVTLLTQNIHSEVLAQKIISGQPLSKKDIKSAKEAVDMVLKGLLKKA